MLRFKRTVLLLAPVLALGFAVPTLAADERATSADPSQRGGDAATAQRRGDLAPITDMRGSKLVGKSVEDANGKNIGEIKDVIVDGSNGRVHYAVLSFDPGWFKSERLYALPLSQFHSGKDRADRLVLNINKERLQAAPGFESDNWPNWNSTDVRRGVDSYHGERVKQSAAGRFVRLSKLLDADLQSADGKDIGDVEDVVVNLQSGQVHYVVVDFDPSFFRAGKLVALPMGAFQAAKDGDDLIVKVDQAKLANAPAFERNRWPDNDRAFNSNFDRWSRDSGYGIGPTAGRPDEMNRATAGRPRGTSPAD